MSSTRYFELPPSSPFSSSDSSTSPQPDFPHSSQSESVARYCLLLQGSSFTFPSSSAAIIQDQENSPSIFPHNLPEAGCSPQSSASSPQQFEPTDTGSHALVAGVIPRVAQVMQSHALLSGSVAMSVYSPNE